MYSTLHTLLPVNDVTTELRLLVQIIKVVEFTKTITRLKTDALTFTHFHYKILLKDPTSYVSDKIT